MTPKSKRKHLPRPEKRRVIYSRSTTAAIELLLYTGCRLSEVLTLRWSAIDLDGGTLALARTKAGRPQAVVMNAQARQIVRELSTTRLAVGTSDYVFPRRADPSKPLSKSALEAAWQKIRAHAEIADVRLHDLRHTVGTYAGQTGANAFLVRDLLRHRNLAMTGRYVNRSDDPVRTLSDQVGERIAAGMASKPPAEVVTLKRPAR